MSYHFECIYSYHKNSVLYVCNTSFMLNNFRDYCCLRQHLTDPTGRMVISSKTTRHPTCPVLKKNWRVQDYQSVMAVRPLHHPDKPGIEFSLTGIEILMIYILDLERMHRKDLLCHRLSDYVFGL